MHTFHFKNELLLRPSPRTDRKNIIWFHFILLSISIQFMIAFLSLYCVCIDCQLSFISAGEYVCLRVAQCRFSTLMRILFCHFCVVVTFWGFYSISQFRIQTYKRISVVLMQVIEFMAKQIENNFFIVVYSPPLAREYAVCTRPIVIQRLDEGKRQASRKKKWKHLQCNNIVWYLPCAQT